MCRVILILSAVLILNCVIVSFSMSTKPFIIGTRGSPLALAQAYETKRLLGVHFPELRPEGAVEIQKIMTKVQTTQIELFNPLLILKK